MVTLKGAKPIRLTEQGFLVIEMPDRGYPAEELSIPILKAVLDKYAARADLQMEVAVLNSMVERKLIEQGYKAKTKREEVCPETADWAVSITQHLAEDTPWAERIAEARALDEEAAAILLYSVGR